MYCPTIPCVTPHQATLHHWTLAHAATLIITTRRLTPRCVTLHQLTTPHTALLCLTIQFIINLYSQYSIPSSTSLKKEFQHILALPKRLWTKFFKYDILNKVLFLDACCPAQSPSNVNFYLLLIRFDILRVVSSWYRCNFETIFLCTYVLLVPSCQW